MVWYEDVDGLETAIEDQLAPHQLFLHLLLGVPLHLVDLILEVRLGLRIVDPVDASLVDKALHPLHQVLVESEELLGLPQ